MSQHNSQFYDTVTGAKPTPSSIPAGASTNPWGNSNINSIDTKREELAYRERISRLASEAGDVTKSPQSRDTAKREHDALVKGLDYQLKCWAAIDASRGAG